MSWLEAVRPYVREMPRGYAVHVVLDASVAVKWLLDEPWSDQARRYLTGALEGHVHIKVPSLFWYELTNVLRYRTTGHPELWELLRAVPVETIELGSGAFQEIEALARDLDITAYDAAYVFLARSLRIPLVTADAKLAERCRDLRFVWPLGLFA